LILRSGRRARPCFGYEQWRWVMGNPGYGWMDAGVWNGMKIRLVLWMERRWMRTGKEGSRLFVFPSWMMIDHVARLLLRLTRRRKLTYRKPQNEHTNPKNRMKQNESNIPITSRLNPTTNPLSGPESPMSHSSSYDRIQPAEAAARSMPLRR
jgi:hypothetical protein